MQSICESTRTRSSERTGLAQAVERGGVRLVVAVGEVEARHVHARVDELAQALHGPAGLGVYVRMFRGRREGQGTGRGGVLTGPSVQTILVLRMALFLWFIVNVGWGGGRERDQCC